MIEHFVFMNGPPLSAHIDRARTKDTLHRTLADDEVAAICSEFLAESDNVASTTTFAIYLVCANPHVRERMVAEIDKYFSEQDGLKGDIEGTPTFKDLDRFPYVEQVLQTRTSAALTKCLHTIH